MREPARIEAQRAILLNSKQAEAYIVLGTLEAQAGRSELAIDSFRKDPKAYKAFKLPNIKLEANVDFEDVSLTLKVLLAEACQNIEP